MTTTTIMTTTTLHTILIPDWQFSTSPLIKLNIHGFNISPIKILLAETWQKTKKKTLLFFEQRNHPLCPETKQIKILTWNLYDKTCSQHFNGRYMPEWSHGTWYLITRFTPKNTWKSWLVFNGKIQLSFHILVGERRHLSLAVLHLRNMTSHSHCKAFNM